MEKKEKLSVMNVALKDISDYYKSTRKAEVIDQLNDPVTHAWAESYMLPSQLLNTPETTRLNRALGLHIINRFQNKI